LALTQAYSAATAIAMHYCAVGKKLEIVNVGKRPEKYFTGHQSPSLCTNKL